MIRQSYTAVVERNREISGRFASEPYECGWAGEAIFFVRKLESEGPVAGAPVKIQISPDGMHWADEGAAFTLTDNEVDFAKVSHFGNWLRLLMELPDGARMKGLITLSLKE